MTFPTSRSPRASDQDLSGRELGDYRLLRRLGRGAMAEVYLAEQRSLGRQVAFKVLKADLATDGTYVQRFHMEARAAASLVHPAIVQIYEVGCIDGIHFIAQEYVQGQNLAEHLTRQGPPQLALAVRLMRQVATALAKSAEQGIVHRDIKPENLMLSRTGEVKVADFGLARVTQTSEHLKLTQVGITMGSPLYMSPEQVEGRPLDPRSDIYSFGVTCYQMLAGRPPFQGDSPLSVAVQHLRSEPERLENLRPDLPPSLCRIVHRMLEKDPAARYANAMELLRDLRALGIQGLEADWPEELDPWNTTESVALSSARIAATQQLSALMKSADTPVPFTRRWPFWLGLGAAFLLGGLLAWPRHEPTLLSDANDAPNGIRRMRSAGEQYFFAMQLGSEPAWRSVLEYFPNDEQYTRLARMQLAEEYLNRDRFEQAMPLFEQFAKLGDGEPELKAYGLAGQYVVLSLEARNEKDPAKAERLHEAAADRLQQLWPLRSRLDPTMARRVSQVLQSSQRRTLRQDAREVDQWLKRHLEPEPSTGN